VMMATLTRDIRPSLEVELRPGSTGRAACRAPMKGVSPRPDPEGDAAPPALRGSTGRGLAVSAGRRARVPGSRLAAASHVANQPPLGVGDWLN
jgi:hypothetical protein